MTNRAAKTIVKQENALFARWKRKHANLYRDGVPDPNSYSQTKIKTLFVLREPNFSGKPHPYDFRHELRKQPHAFWRHKVAPWCNGLSDYTATVAFLWKQFKNLDEERISKVLGRFAYVQLKEPLI